MRTLLFIFLALLQIAACPSRSFTYTAGGVIDPAQVTTNEDNLYNKFCTGVDTYVDGTVTSADLTDGTITSNDMSSNAVTSATIADATIIGADIASNTINGTKLAIGSDTQGDVLYYDGTDWARLGVGTSGQFLKTNGAAANPAWASAGAVVVADRVQYTTADVTTVATSLTDLTGASITLTTGANPVLIGFSGTWLDDSTRTLTLNFDVDGTKVLGTVGVQSVMIANEAQPITVVAMTDDLTAASHTFKVQWYQSSAGGAVATMKGGSDLPYNFWVVEVTD